MENTVLYGNGLNHGAKNSISWNHLLTQLGDQYDLLNRFDDQKSKHTMYYEQVVMQCDVASDIKVHEESIKVRIAKTLSQIEPTEVLLKLKELNVRNFITTNYDNTFRNVLLANQFELNKSFYPNKETLYSIRRGYECFSHDKNVRIWYIHGEVDHPKTIMLGYDQYCSSTSKIDQYVKGNYSSKDTGPVNSIFQRLKSNEKLHENSKSWIDLFFSTNVHIVGFGLDYSEIDIWWLLNYRARLMKNSSIGEHITNEIFYYGDEHLDDEKRAYLEAFNVKVVKKMESESYPTFYESVFNNL